MAKLPLHSVLSEPIALLLRITNKRRLIIQFNPKYYTFSETGEHEELYGRHIYCHRGSDGQGEGVLGGPLRVGGGPYESSQRGRLV